MKRGLHITLGLLILPVILLLWLATTESGLQWGYQQARTYLPAGLSFQKLQGRLTGPITLTQLAYEQDGTHATAEQIIFNWHPLSLFTGSVDIGQLHIHTLNITLPETLKTTDQAPLQLPAIQLPWRTVVTNLQIDNFSFSQGEQQITLQKVGLQATTLLNKIDIKSLSVASHDLNLEINGALWASRQYRHDLQIKWQATLPSNALLSGTGKLVGNMQATHLQQQISGPAQFTLEADIRDLLEQLSWQARLEASAFNAAELFADGPVLTGSLSVQASGNLETATATGSMQGNYADAGPFDAEFDVQRLADTSLQINRLALHSASGETDITAQGQWLPGDQGGSVKLALDWKNLRWPLHDGAWFNTASGHGTLAGGLTNYRIDVTTDRPWAEAPPSIWRARANGNAEGMKFESLQVSTLGGEVNASGQLNWAPQLNWQVKINASNIDPSSLWPQWPGQINANLSSRGRLENNQLVVDTEVTQLQGTLRSYPVSLRSRLSWNNRGFDVDQLEFHSASSRLSAQGRAGETLKLDWNIDTPNLGELYPHAKGQFKASGTLAGPINAPFVSGTFNGQALSLADYAIGSIDANVAIDLAHWQKIDIQLKAQSLKYKSTELQALTISADTKQLHAQLTAAAASADIALKGSIDNNGWSGLIERADIISQSYDNWQLKNPVALSINQHTLQADALCWHNAAQAYMCSTLSRLHDNWQAQIEMSQLPLKLLEPWIPLDLQLEGATNARAQLQLLAGDKLLGDMRIDLPPGALSYPLLEGERSRWEYHGGTITATQDMQGLRSRANIAMSNGDRLSISAELPDAMLLNLDPAQQQLHAEAQLTAHDLGLIEAMLPEVQDLKGEVRLSATADGTLAQPKISGEAHLVKGEFRVPRLGLSIKPLSLTAKTDGANKIMLQANAHSGEGELSIQGDTTLDRSAGWPTRIAIKGKHFEVSQIPEARVLISPDLLITVQHNLINIDGTIDIPNAKLQPKDISTATRVSDDVVIIGGEQQAQQKWLVTTRVRVTLGERVNFYGFGFEGRFGGNLLIEDTPGQLTRATGEINIPEGTYRAYGQRLEVEHGRLIYTGTPLSNPGLDIRAVRHINNVTAGLKVFGSLNHPQIELFSIPAMGQTDALSYLVLGRPMETTSSDDGAVVAKAALAFGLSGGDRLARLLGDRFGLDEMRIESNDTGDQASLVVGRYLSPKLYVSYGVGLIEAINTFAVRYTISDNWQLKAESGEAQGADIFYTIER